MLENGTVKCGDGFEDYDKRVKMLNGKVIGEYICDDIVELEYDELEECYMFKNCYCGYILDEILSASCLSYDELCKYGNRKPIYLWHITKLKIYDEPKELRHFIIIAEKSLIAKIVLSFMLKATKLLELMKNVNQKREAGNH